MNLGPLGKINPDGTSIEEDIQIDLDRIPKSSSKYIICGYCGTPRQQDELQCKMCGSYVVDSVD